MGNARLSPPSSVPEGRQSLLALQRLTGVHRDTIERLCRSGGIPIEVVRGVRTVPAPWSAEAWEQCNLWRERERPHRSHAPAV